MTVSIFTTQDIEFRRSLWGLVQKEVSFAESVSEALRWLQVVEIHKEGTRDSFSILMRLLEETSPQSETARKMIDPVLKVLGRMKTTERFYDEDLKKSIEFAGETVHQAQQTLTIHESFKSATVASGVREGGFSTPRRKQAAPQFSSPGSTEVSETVTEYQRGIDDSQIEDAK